jgi:hypothetical protein
MTGPGGGTRPRAVEGVGRMGIPIPEAESVRNSLGNCDDGPIIALTVQGRTQLIRTRECDGGFGGKRYFILCPTCGRLYRKLFLPPGEQDFACRRCFRLRYTSQGRDLDFFLKPIAAQSGLPRRIVRRQLEEMWAIADREMLRKRPQSME